MKTHSLVNQQDIPRSTLIKVFVALAIIAFVLRIFYAGYLFQDDGLWFTAAEELLRGKALYREIYFDKPPMLPLVYALLFKLFGAHILTIRLFTIVYSLAVAFALSRCGAFLYHKSTGLLAAAMFVIFSTTYLTGHFQGLNTDFLMTLPYTLGAYWFTRACMDRQASRATRLGLALAAGIAVGLAFQTNPKAIFNLLFFVLCSLAVWSLESGVWSQKTEDSSQKSVVRSQESQDEDRNQVTKDKGQRTKNKGQGTRDCLLPTALAGFLLGALPFWIYLAATHSLPEYRFYVWEWGAKYAAYFSLKDSLLLALTQSVGYFALNSILLFGLLFVMTATLKQMRERRASRHQALNLATVAGSVSEARFKADAVLLIWFVTSYAAMSVGGRFFGHYFFQILPCLCLLAGRGVSGILAALVSSGNQKRGLRRAVYALLIAGFLLTLVRFHTRTAILAWDWARGAKSELTATWNHEKLNREERLVAAAVKDLPDDFAAIERLGIEGLRDQTSQTRSDEAGDKYLFVWGYRPEIYFWAGNKPASRFLSAQPLTGVPSDVHYFGDAYVSVLDEKTSAAFREQLLGDLQATRPVYIIDELGFFNDDLAMKNYPELKEFLADYKFAESRGRALIYYRPKNKNKKQNSTE